MNKEEKRDYDKQYYKKNKDKINTQSAGWQKNHTERVKEIRKKYYENYKLKNGFCPSTRWAKNNPERIKEIKRKYRDIHNNEARYWISEKISYWRKKFPKVKSDLTTDYLFNLFNKQNGQCYYTGHVMVWGLRQRKALPNTPSLDRLIPERGYIKGNVVWCSFFVNTMKGNLSEKCFYDYINKVLKHRRIKP